ncbi:MAG TPA: hypothetical protein VGP92_13840 [Acidimicrobiia bacterium]|nr:hypothetical protein [Acidimicrobiia bacterium]
MIDLESALLDLAEHLDRPTGEGLTGAVVSRISTPAPAAGSSARTRMLLAIAAVVLVIVGAVLAIAPARNAVADWLGIGAVDIRRSEHPLPPGPSSLTVPGAPGTARDRAALRKLAAARRAVKFTIAMPTARLAGTLSGVEVDQRVPGGLVALRYTRFTLVEIAIDPAGPTIAKFIDPGVVVEPAVVGGAPGFWVTGAHDLLYIDRHGTTRIETVRRSGPVLVWAKGAVTYRVEGFRRRADAQRIADSVR